MFKANVLVLIIALLASTSCGAASPAAPSIPERSGYTGEWSGATQQGAAMSFTVSAEQKVTGITITYNLNGCSGARTFSGLSLGIDTSSRPPNSPSTGPFDNPRFGYTSGAFDQPNFISVSGAFTSTETATGVTGFIDFFGCGNGVANWNAIRR